MTYCIFTGFNAGQLHGDMAQPARMETLSRFKNGDITLLVCSDVAARGLDIQDMSHVFNFDVPTHPEDYVHRIGRTGRAGRQGHAYTLAVPSDAKNVSAIESLIGKPIPHITVEGSAPAALDPNAVPHRGPGRGGPGRGGPGRGGRGHGGSSRGGHDRGRGHGHGEHRAERPPEHRAERPLNTAPRPAEAPAPVAPRANTAERHRGQHREPRRNHRPEPLRDQADHGQGKPVKGMGEYLPAFLRGK